MRLGRAGGRVWLAGLVDRRAWALSGSGVGRVAGLGFAWAKTAPDRRRRGGRRPAALELGDGLSSGLRGCLVFCLVFGVGLRSRSGGLGFWECWVPSLIV